MSTPGTPLTCLEMVARLDDYVDRELDPEEIRKVEDHLAGCLACAHEYRFEAGLLEGIRRRMQRIAVPAELLGAVRARLQRERGTNPGSAAL